MSNDGIYCPTSRHIALLGALLLSACAPATTNQSTVQTKSEAEIALEKAAPGGDRAFQTPETAIPVRDDLYAVPLAVDREGCEQFTTWSTTGIKHLAQPIQYHDGEGSFSPVKMAGISCNATMVRAGKDRDGCPTFRAEQPDGTSSEVTYYAFHNGYTARKGRSKCR